MINNIKHYLQNEVDRTELNDKEVCDSKDDFILYGRQECANDLLALIEKWEGINNKGSNHG